MYIILIFSFHHTFLALFQLPVYICTILFCLSTNLKFETKKYLIIWRYDFSTLRTITLGFGWRDVIFCTYNFPIWKASSMSGRFFFSRWCQMEPHLAFWRAHWGWSVMVWTCRGTARCWAPRGSCRCCPPPPGGTLNNKL